MALHLGRLSRLFKSLPLLAKMNCESGYFNALHGQPLLSVRVQLFSDVHSGSKRPFLDWKTLEKTRLELNETSPDAEPYDISKEQRFMLTADDPKLCEELEKLLLFLYITKQRGEHMPTHITLSDLKKMLEKNYVTRLKCIKSIVKKELMGKIKTKHKEEALKDMEKGQIEMRNDFDADVPWLSYHLFGNALFQRILKKTVHASENLYVAQWMQFEQNLVFDCSFDHLMRFKDATDCAQQILLALASNRIKRRPYNITLCNFHANDKMPSKLISGNPTLFDSPLTMTEKNVEEVFPREKLVYLTPDSYDDLDYDPNDIYVIGAFVNRFDSEPYEAGRARRLGIRMARFPLDKYAYWHPGGRKHLCLNQVFDILSTVKDDGDWSKAFALHVPQRKIKSVFQQGSQEQNHGFKKKKFYSRRH